MESEPIKKGLKACMRTEYNSIIAPGHSEYYSKFGFKLEHRWEIKNPFGAPADAFITLELKETTLEGARGKSEYLDEFSKL